MSDGSLDEDKLLEKLVKTFDIHQFPNAQQFVLQGLKNGLFLLLFDGLDEVNSDVRDHVSSVIRDFLKKYEQCRVVITCRETVYNEEFSDIVKHKLKMAEFSNRQIRQFLKFWEPEMRQVGKSIKQMMEDIEERPLILKLAHNPLLLTLIAYLYTESDFVLPHSRAELYQKSASILLEERQYKNYDDYKYQYEADDKRRILECLALYIQNSSSNKDLRSVTVGAAREQAKITLVDVGLAQGNPREILDEIVERSGLIIKGKDKISGEEYYIFSHSTIQEYFAAAALKEQEGELIQRYEANPTAWQEVIKLWCSLANESTNVVRTVYKQDALMGFECLAEARQINPTLVNQIIDYFKPKLNELQPNDTLVQTFGTVAASKDEPGIAVFDFLALKLYERNASDVFRNAVASALSRTNLSKAADCLVDEWKGGREPIVRMGDLAVPALKKQAHKANSRAQDDLYRIRTPDAIDALVSLLWHKEGFIANRAAQFLSRLLFREDIKEVLRNYELTAQQRESEIIDWIWQPFNKESSDSSLPTIAGRIAYLLKEILFIPKKREALPDPRLVVPICAVESPINSLPDHIPATVEALLKRADGLTEANYIRASDKLLANISTSDQHWKQLLRTLPPILELDLLSRLIAQRQQHQHNYRKYWQDLFRPVDYELRTGWHYRSILTFAAVMTIIAISKVGFSIFTDPENPFFIASAVIVICINLIFWVTLYQSDNKILTPDLFWELGPKGIYTYTQCIQLYRKGLTWPLVDNLYRAISNRRVSFVIVIASGIAFIARVISMFFVSHNTVAGAEFGIIDGIIGGAFLMAGTVIVTAFIFAIVTISVALIVFVLISSAVAIAIAIKGNGDREKAMVGARLVNYAIESFLTGTGDASVIATASLATGIATGAIATAIDFEINFAFVFAGVIVGIGIGAWCQAKITPENLWLRFLMVLAFPYFCWFPLTATFSTWAIYDSLAIISPFSFPFWQQTSTVLLVITGLCAVLWWRGKWLDTRAKNPFHGGALGKALGVNQ